MSPSELLKMRSPKTDSSEFTTNVRSETSLVEYSKFVNSYFVHLAKILYSWCQKWDSLERS